MSSRVLNESRATVGAFFQLNFEPIQLVLVHHEVVLHVRRLCVAFIEAQLGVLHIAVTFAAFAEV